MASLAQRLAVVAAAFSNDPADACRAARSSGFAGILFDARTPTLDLTTLSATGRREFRHLIASQNLSLVALRTQLPAQGFAPGADVDRILSLLSAMMESAVALGAPLLCIDLGPLPPAPHEKQQRTQTIDADLLGAIILPAAPPLPPAPEPAHTEKDRAFAAQLDSVLRDLCARADRYSCLLALRSDLAPFASLDAALKPIACPWFGVDLDAVALLRDRWTIDETFSRLGPLIRHVRLRDAVLGTDGRTRTSPIGNGAVKWEELLAHLEESPFAGWLTIDPLELTDRRAGALAGAEYLRRLRP